MNRLGPEEMYKLRQNLISKGVTPGISKADIKNNEVTVSGVILTVQFYDQHSAAPGQIVQYACPVSEFYDLRTTKQNELIQINQVISWIETH